MHWCDSISRQGFYLKAFLQQVKGVQIKYARNKRSGSNKYRPSILVNGVAP